MNSTRNPSVRAFWADILAKARTEELLEIADTLAARRGCEGSEADSDLLVLARRILAERCLPAPTGAS